MKRIERGLERGSREVNPGQASKACCGCREKLLVQNWPLLSAPSRSSVSLTLVALFQPAPPLGTYSPVEVEGKNRDSRLLQSLRVSGRW